MKLQSVKFVFKTSPEKDEASRCFWDCLVRLSLTGLDPRSRTGGEKKETLLCFVFYHYDPVSL